jgi:hypothetical protein
MTGERFAELVESIRESGQTAPIIQANDGSILDGRNRLLAIEQLRAEGHDIEPWIEQWEPEGGQTEGEFILAANLHRRHLTDDQRAMIVAELVPFIKAEAEERQKATRFKKGKTKNVAGPNQYASKEAAATDPSPPPLKTTKRTSAEKEAGSTRGQVAGRGDVSSHKAGKAIAVQRSGDKQIIKKVKDGDMTLAQAEKVVKPKAKKTKAKTEPYDLAAEVKTRWGKFLGHFATTEYEEVREIVKQLIATEEKPQRGRRG